MHPHCLLFPDSMAVAYNPDEIRSAAGESREQSLPEEADTLGNQSEALPEPPGQSETQSGIGIQGDSLRRETLLPNGQNDPQDPEAIPSPSQLQRAPPSSTNTRARSGNRRRNNNVAAARGVSGVVGWRMRAQQRAQSTQQQRLITTFERVVPYFEIIILWYKNYKYI